MNNPLSSWTACSSALTLAERKKANQPLFVLGDVVTSQIKGEYDIPHVICSISNDKLGLTNIKKSISYCTIFRPPSNFTLQNKTYFSSSSTSTSSVVPSEPSIPATSMINLTNSSVAHLDNTSFSNNLQLTWIGPYQIDLQLYGAYDKPRCPNELFNMADIKMTHESYMLWYHKICAHNAIPIVKDIFNWEVITKPKVVLETEKEETESESESEYESESESDLESSDSDSKYDSDESMSSDSDCRIMTKTKTTKSRIIQNQKKIKKQINRSKQQQPSKQKPKLDNTYPYINVALFATHITKITIRFLVLCTSYSSSELLFHLEPYKLKKTDASIEMSKDELDEISKIGPSPCLSFHSNYESIASSYTNFFHDTNDIQLRPYQFNDIAFITYQESTPHSMYKSIIKEETPYKQCVLPCSSVYYHPAFQYIQITKQLSDVRGGWLADDSGMGKRTTMLAYLIYSIQNNPKQENQPTLCLISEAQILSWKVLCKSMLEPYHIHYDFNHSWRKEYELQQSSQNTSTNQIYFMTKKYVMEKVSKDEQVFLFHKKTWKRVIFEDGFILKPCNRMMNIMDMLPSTCYRWILISQMHALNEWHEWLGQLQWFQITTLFDSKQLEYFNRWMQSIIQLKMDGLVKENNHLYQEYKMSKDSITRLSSIYSFLTPYNQYVVRHIVDFWKQLFENHMIRHVPDQRLGDLKPILQMQLPVIELVIIPWHSEKEKKDYEVLDTFYRLKYQDYIQYNNKRPSNSASTHVNLKRKKIGANYTLHPNQLLRSCLEQLDGASEIDLFQLNTQRNISINLRHYLKSDKKTYYPEFNLTMFISQNDDTAKDTPSPSQEELQDRLHSECPICFNILSIPLIMKCGHVFCKDCIFTHYEMNVINSHQCPNCRAKISEDKFFRPKNQDVENTIIRHLNLNSKKSKINATIEPEKEEEEPEEEVAVSLEIIAIDAQENECIYFQSKMDYCIQQLKSNNTNKVLILSHFPEFLKKLYELMKDYNPNGKFMKNKLLLSQIQTQTDQSFASYYIEYGKQIPDRCKFVFWCTKDGAVSRAILDTIQEVWMIEPASNPEMYLSWMNLFKTNKSSQPILWKHFYLEQTIEEKIVLWYIEHAEKWLKQKNKSSSFATTFVYPEEVLKSLYV